MKSLIDQTIDFVAQAKEKYGENFFTIFDGGKDFTDAMKKASDIFNRQVLPYAKKHLTWDLSKTQSLDVGYGSGFQVLEASKHFIFSAGLDVHKVGPYIVDTFEKKGFGVDKILFLRSSADDILVLPNSYGFVHSWVTFLHFPSIEYTKKVLSEIFRVLKPKGVAVIYYPRLVKTKRMETFQEYENGLKVEETDKEGCREQGSLTKVFKKGITIARWKMVELVQDVGFEILEHSCSNEGGFVFGQHGIIIRKPALVELEKKPRLVRRKKIKKIGIEK